MKELDFQNFYTGISQWLLSLHDSFFTQSKHNFQNTIINKHSFLSLTIVPLDLFNKATYYPYLGWNMVIFEFFSDLGYKRSFDQ